MNDILNKMFQIRKLFYYLQKNQCDKTKKENEKQDLKLLISDNIIQLNGNNNFNKFTIN